MLSKITLHQIFKGDPPLGACSFIRNVSFLLAAPIKTLSIARELDNAGAEACSSVIERYLEF